ncbi:radical SAM protein [candidate division WOR-3 bacterium]|nr:radical SAM protein [candidate division WOR-3 bacterium]
MESFKPSKYNFYLSLKNGIYCVFNSLSGGAVELNNKDNFKKFTEFIKTPSAFIESKEYDSIKRKALQYNFIVPMEIDEMKMIAINSRALAFDTSTLHLTLYPTMNCNFNCIYCYEGNHNNTIDKFINDETIGRIKKFVDRKTKRSSVLRLTWYGGEPTLAWEKIQLMTKEFINICKKNSCKYTSGIITNGYLLTPEKTQALVDLKIKKVQITLDGPPSIHNRRRPLINGDPTFEKIVKNIHSIPEGVEIFIRVNVDKKNANSVIRFLDYIKDLKSKIKITFMPVWTMSSTNENYKFCYDIVSFYDVNIFAELCGNLMMETLKRGFHLFYDQLPIRSGCDMVKFNTWEIDERANLYKCPLTVHEKKYKLGCINQEGEIEITNMPLYLETLSYDPIEAREVCSKCRFLPMCGGYCKLSADVYGDPNTPEECMNFSIEALKQMLAIQHFKKHKSGE